MPQTPNGNSSAFHSRTAAGKGHSWKRHLRIERIARLVAAGQFKNEEIAMAVGVAPITVSQIRMTPEFRAKLIEVSTGVISQFDQDIRMMEENQIEELASMVPLALLGLRNAAMSRNPNVALKANLEILDRHGVLAKVSKVNVVHSEKPDMDRMNRSATNILAIFNRPVGGELEDGANDIMNSFTVSANDATQQVRAMGEIIDASTLENLDLTKEKVQ